MKIKEHLGIEDNRKSDKDTSKYKIVSDKYFYELYKNDFSDDKRKQVKEGLNARLIKSEKSSLDKNESFIAKLKSKNNLIALIYILLAVVIFSASNLISKILIENNKSLGFDSINLVMGITMLVINMFLREREIRAELDSPAGSKKESFLRSNNNNNNNNFSSNDHSRVYFNSSFASYEKHETENFINYKNKDQKNPSSNIKEKNKKEKNSESFINSKNENNAITERKFLHVISDVKSELDEDFSMTTIFLIRCLLGTFAEIFLFFSFKDLRINTAVTLYTVYPIISSFLSYLYLETNTNKSRQTRIRDFLFLIFCLVFVSFITKPTFIFGAPDAAMKQDSIAGFVNIMMSVLCNAFAIFFHKKVAEKFNNYTFNIFFGINFIWFSFFLMLFDRLTIFNLDLVTVFLLFLMSLLFNLSQTLFNLCIKLGEIVVVLPMTYLNIVFGFLNNILFMKGVWDYFDLFGSFGIIFINVYRIFLTSKEE